MGDAIEEVRDRARHAGRQRAGVGDVGVGLVARDGKQLPEFILPAHAQPCSSDHFGMRAF
ncbi:hypothetical protein D3C79_993400 [compost metagenome]